MDSFPKRMEEVTEDLFRNVSDIFKKSHLKTQDYFNCIDFFVDRTKYRKKTYCLVFELTIEDYLYARFGFAEQPENAFIPLTDAEKLFPEF